jgi:catechol 2,3-dioxygenase-like lactoylglutathione lyase family enzyme
MPTLDHLAIPVSDWRRSRDWYVEHLGFKAEFEVANGGPAGLGVAAVQDEAGLTIFLEQVVGPVLSGQGGYTLRLEDVEAFCADQVARGLTFVSAPAKQFWGYGAVIADPDGHRFHLYDETSMREKGG